MLILVTGAFGRVGSMVLEEATRQGHTLRCTDLDNPNTQAEAEKWRAQGAEIMLGDLRDEDLVNRLVEGVDAVIHNAALLPPFTEMKPELAHEINVKATTALVQAAAKQSQLKRFVFPSSFTVFGYSDNSGKLKTPEDPITGTNVYTTTKVNAENAIRPVNFPWVIVRLGASIDETTNDSVTPEDKAYGFQIGADVPEHWVHPKDVALAMCNAVKADEATHKTLLLGGDKSCMVAHYDLVNIFFRAMGLNAPRSLFGDGKFQSHWMDTSESQRILQFQKHSFADFEKLVFERYKTTRLFLKPISFLINPILPWAIRTFVIKA